MCGSPVVVLHQRWEQSACPEEPSCASLQPCAHLLGPLGGVGWPSGTALHNPSLGNHPSCKRGCVWCASRGQEVPQGDSSCGAKKKGRKSQKAPTETGAQTYLTLEEMRVKEGGTWGGKPCPNDRHSPEVLCQHTVSVVSPKPVPECQADSESLEYSMNKYLQYLLTTGSSGNSLKFLSAK